MNDDRHRCGYIAIVGRPNVGKSTLINKIVGEKVSIVSSKPQTTRHRILGIVTRPDAQLVFVDTPGLHKAKGKVLNKVINRTARSVINGIDVLLFVIEAKGWQQEDDNVLDLIRDSGLPVVLAINKTDRQKRKLELLPLIKQVAEKWQFTHIVPVSAKTGDNLDSLLGSITPLLPPGPPGFPEKQYTDRGARFRACELIREQIFRGLGEELPYAVAVEIADYVREAKIDRVAANIWVEHDSQKGILIGKNGRKIRDIGTRARQQMEDMLKRKVFLDLRVKVRSGWANDQDFLRQIGYSEKI